jgi:hypothetical protein
LITPAFSIVETSLGSSTTQRSCGRALVAADAAELALGDVAAFPAEEDALLRLDDRLGEPLGVVGRRLHQVEREPLRRLGPMPGRRESSSIRSWIGPSYT